MARKAVLEGAIPIVPHLYFTQFLDDNKPEEQELGICMGLILLRECDEMWVCGECISSGMETELDFATKHDIPIKYM